jgi:hypothetical protein
MRKQVENVEMGGVCIVHGKVGTIIQDIGGKPDGMRQVARPKHSWESSIKKERKKERKKAVNGV